MHQPNRLHTGVDPFVHPLLHVYRQVIASDHFGDQIRDYAARIRVRGFFVREAAGEDQRDAWPTDEIGIVCEASIGEIRQHPGGTSRFGILEEPGKYLSRDVLRDNRSPPFEESAVDPFVALALVWEFQEAFRPCVSDHSALPNAVHGINITKGHCGEDEDERARDEY